MIYNVIFKGLRWRIRILVNDNYIDLFVIRFAVNIHRLFDLLHLFFFVRPVNWIFTNDAWTCLLSKTKKRVRISLSLISNLLMLTRQDISPCCGLFCDITEAGAVGSEALRVSDLGGGKSCAG